VTRSARDPEPGEALARKLYREALAALRAAEAAAARFTHASRDRMARGVIGAGFNQVGDSLVEFAACQYGITEPPPAD